MHCWFLIRSFTISRVDDRKLLVALDGGKFDCAVIEALTAKQKTKSVNSEFKISFRSSFLFEMEQVIFDLFEVEFRGQAIILQGNMRDAAHIVVERAWTFATNDDLSLKFLINSVLG